MKGTMRVAAVAVATALALIMSGCDKGPEATQAPTPDPAAAYQILIDISSGYPITANRVQGVVEQVATAAAAEPGTTVQLFVLGQDIGRTRQIYSATSEVPKSKAKRLVVGHRRRWVGEVLDGAALAIATSMNEPRPTASPLCAGISKMARARPSPGPVVLVVVSDLLEYSDGQDLECGRIDAVSFQRWAKERHYLLEGSLSGYAVHLAYVDAGVIAGNRCAARLSRRNQVDALWVHQLLPGAGVEPGAIHLTTGQPNLDRAEDGAGREVPA